MVEVEIYDERELDPATLKVEPDAEALALIQELGLTQVQTNEGGSRIAYPNPTSDQAFVMEMLFPQATWLDQYNAGAIPLRVLKEIRSYRAENPSHVLIVRHCAPAQVKDPVLLAYTGTDCHWMATQSRGGWKDKRLIARWGDALEGWDKLVVKAVAAATKATDSALAAIIGECELLRARIAKGQVIQTSEMPHFNMPRGSDPF